jgi:hypothetical protein
LIPVLRTTAARIGMGMMEIMLLGLESTGLG